MGRHCQANESFIEVKPNGWWSSTQIRLDGSALCSLAPVLDSFIESRRYDWMRSPKMCRFYRAMLCMRGTSRGPVSVSVTSRCSTKTTRLRITQTTKSNRKSYALYRMVALPMTLSATQSLQTTPFSAFCTAIHSFVTGEPRDFKFGTLIFHSKSHHADEKSSLKGVWSGSPILTHAFGAPVGGDPGGISRRSLASEN